MNVFEHAMKMEEDGRTYYLEAAKKTNIVELKRVLVELAEDELKHYNIFKAMRDNKAAGTDFGESTTILSTAKNVFESLRENPGDMTSFSNDAIKIWEEAREIEKQAEAFYRDSIGKTENEAEKRLLSQIADEEHRHWVALENVVSFLQKPKEWLEDAEWHGLSD